jgi:glycosyltransferase involved in cell wall biosynthesis
MASGALVVLCDSVGHDGGTESYLERVLPELGRGDVALTLLARQVLDQNAYGVPAHAIGWGGEDDAPDEAAAERVAAILREIRPATVLTSNVFDEAVLRVARSAPRMAVRLHDHRAFCPNGDRRFPQFPSNCGDAMGAACVRNALLHGCVAGPRRETLNRIDARARVRDAIAAADTIIVSSRFMAGICTRNGIDPARIVVAPPPLARESYAAEPAPQPARPRLLFASRALPQKGLSSLVRALGRIAPAHRPTLRVASERSTELQSAQTLAYRLGVTMNCLGHLTQPQLRCAIDEVHAVAVPSLWPEPFGLVGIEAQARGRPAVAYAAGGIPEWIDGAGTAVPVGDERALAKAIVDIIDGSAWSDRSHAALDRAQAFHIDRHIATLRETLWAS